MKPPVEDCWLTTVLCIFLLVLCLLVGWVSTSADRVLLFWVPSQGVYYQSMYTEHHMGLYGSPHHAKMFKLLP